jgi:uncharacterized membrane protein YsdA (DUF1294 family)
MAVRSAPRAEGEGLALYILWNLAGFILVMLDKRRASRAEWRIRERTFFLWSLVFGAGGILLGMYVFRHKTRHLSFKVGMPTLFLFNLACGYFLWR